MLDMPVQIKQNMENLVETKKQKKNTNKQMDKLKTN